MKSDITSAVEILRDGGVVAVPTDTLFGLAASALNVKAVERIFRMKARPKDMAIPLLLAGPKSDDRGYVPGYWKKTKILHDNQIIDDMIFQELGLINEIRNEFMHSFEPNNQKILDFCNFLLYHPYNDRKSNVEKAAYDALEIMSQLCEILDKTKNF